MNNFKMWKHRSIAGFVAAACVGLASCSEPPEAKEAPAIRPAKLFEVAQSQNTRTMNLPAVISARSTADLTFEVNGVLQEFPVVEGQEVAEGDLIGQLEQRAFQNQVAQAGATYRNAQSQFSRAAQLIKKGTIAQKTYDERLKDRDVARTALDDAQKQLDDSTLRAPFAGVIATKYVDQFQTVGAQSVIVTLQSTGAAEAIVQVPSTLVANSGQIDVAESYVVLDAAPDREVPAQIVSTSTQTDPRTQTFQVRFAFEPPEDLVILPGMTGTLRSKLQIANRNGTDGRITIPRTAVFAQAEELFAWKVDAETMTVSRTAITISQEGPDVGADVVVTSGLVAGDTIVAAGVSFLTEGTQIRAFEQ
ncbi:efflux RND transporter periplasmic adaptor subunit [Pyruvatibacter sp.]|uniref:efflux RND transporter periplasmic adaptor subunit n=1 Tax=Pyruvatibacter sp. TaxID=1981328 RepID=UPI00326699AA